MKKVFLLSLLWILPAYSQEYIEGNTYYDTNGKAYYYAEDGNAYYYPDNVQEPTMSNNSINRIRLYDLPSSDREKLRNTPLSNEEYTDYLSLIDLVNNGESDTYQKYIGFINDYNERIDTEKCNILMKKVDEYFGTADFNNYLIFPHIDGKKKILSNFKSGKLMGCKYYASNECPWKVNDYTPEGILLRNSDGKIIHIYTDNTDFVTNECYKDEYVYEKTKNYKYTTVMGGTMVVLAFKKTDIKSDTFDKEKVGRKRIYTKIEMASAAYSDAMDEIFESDLGKFLLMGL